MERPPNIVLINCDDLGWGDLGCYGSAANDTPHLDRLAAEGMLFTDFTMASPVCSPSRAALLTGCLPPRIGMGSFDGFPVLFPGHHLGLNPNEHTVAGVLQSAGYATKLVGKWHCGDQPEFLPTNHGFDSYYGLPYSNDMGRQALRAGTPPLHEVLAKWGLKLPVDDLPPLPLMRDRDVIEEQPDQAGLTARYIEQSVEFMRTQRDRPFFLYLAHLYVHVPLYVQARFAEESRNGRYGAAVAAIDWATGVIMHELAALGLDESTLVIFTSDNGSRGVDGGSNGPLRGAKGSTWEGGMRVPMIARWPGHIPAGSTCAEPATSVDLYPSLAALAGTTAPMESVIDGRDMRWMLGLGHVGSVTHIAERADDDPLAYYRADDLEAVRSGRWKLHVARGRQAICELYDLRDDRGETTDIAASHADVVAHLEAMAEVIRRDLGDARLGVVGAARRPSGTVEQPTTLTTFDPSHPYYMAEYDLPDRG